MKQRDLIHSRIKMTQKCRHKLSVAAAASVSWRPRPCTVSQGNADRPDQMLGPKSTWFLQPTRITSSKTQFLR